MKNIILTPETNINAIVVVDKNNHQVFQSKDMDMTVSEYVSRASFNEILNGAPKMPSIYNHTLEFVMGGDGITSKGYTYKASAYKYEDTDKLIFVNVIEGIVETI